MYDGLALSAYGENTMTQQVAGTDILTLTGATSQTADFLVTETVAGVEKFVVEDGGNILVTGDAADVLIKATQAASPTVDALQILSSAASRVFSVDSGGQISTMVLATRAVASLASNASASFSLAGLTTDHAVQVIPLKALTTGNGILAAYAQGTTRVDAYALGGSIAANTYAVWAFKTVAN